MRRQYPRIPIVTDWEAYTPTFTGFGTVNVSDFFWMRMGGAVLIQGRFTAGTPTGVEARVSLPLGVTAATTYVTLETAGPAGTDQTNTALFTLIEPSKTYMTFGYMNSTNSNLVKGNGSAIVGTGGIISVNAIIRVPGWTANRRGGR